MRRGQETGESILNMNTALAQMIVVEACQRMFVVEVEVEPARVTLDLGRHPPACEQRVQPAGQAGGFLRQILLQRRPLFLDVIEHGPHRCEHKGMAHEGAGEERHADFGEGFIAEAPLTAVECIHELVAAGQDADRQAAPDDLAVSCQIRPHADHGLHPARVDAKAGDDLVHDERSTRCLGDFADFAQEIEGP